MEIRNKKTRGLLPVAAVLCAVAAVWFGCSANPAMAVRDPEISSFSFGAAAGQTVRLSVFNCGDDQGFIVNWALLDSDGDALRRSPEPRTVAPGKTVSFAVDADELDTMRDSLGRIQMRAVVKGIGNPDTFNRRAGVSVEVVENVTGKTATFISAAAVKGCSNNL